MYIILEDIKELESGRLAQTKESAVYNNDETKFIAQFKTGFNPTEIEKPFLLTLEQLEVEMLKEEWVKQNPLDTIFKK